MVKGSDAVQIRRVNTPFGTVEYALRRKRVKNLNLRVERDRSVVLSVPLGCGAERADAFVREKSGWITDTLERLREEQQVPLPPLPEKEVCRIRLNGAVARVYPLVIPYGVPLPALKLRRMRSQWGNCHWRQGYITLNTALSRCPEELQDYVALHELVHFLHHDHGPGFYGVMDRLMPDWKVRRKLLRSYSAALD